MANNTRLDEIIEYPYKIGQMLFVSKEIIGLLVNDPNVDIKSIDLMGKQIFDFDYIGGVQEEEMSYICIDTNEVYIQNKTIKDVELNIYVISHKNNMKLDPKIFKGVKGNRRDNLIRQIDLVLNGSRDFGIGTIELTRVRRIVCPTNYTGKVMVYRVSDFNKVRSVC